MRWIFCLMCWLGLLGLCHAQEKTRLPRTIKVYPLNVFRSELGLGYEHGLTQRLSISSQLSFMGSGTFSQIHGQRTTDVDDACTFVWPTKGISVKTGARFYPSKLKRSAPFFAEALLVYRRLVFPEMHEFAFGPCNSMQSPRRQVHPVVERIGIQLMIGAAMRRDKFFTVDMYGGLGFHARVTRWNAEVSDPNFSNPLFGPETVETHFAPSFHLGFSLGLNLHGYKRR